MLYKGCSFSKTCKVEKTCKILARASSVGCGNSIFRSNRPDLIRAGSKTSARLVAAITCKSAVRK